MIAIHLRVVFFFNDTATTEIYTLSLHDALPILLQLQQRNAELVQGWTSDVIEALSEQTEHNVRTAEAFAQDRKSTRLNSSHANISYAVFCLKKKITIKMFSLSQKTRSIYI